jgi:serralysin
LLTSGLTTIEQLTLLSGNISGTGNRLANVITGSAGANTLKGDLGNDVLTGGLGSDKLYGEAGKDTLTGGTGRDVFIFTAALNPHTNVDHITDFSHVYDTIQLAHGAFAALTHKGALSPAAFTLGAHAHDESDRIIYNKATGALYYDSDGVGGHAQIEFAVLTHHPSIAANDFVVI